MNYSKRLWLAVGAGAALGVFCIIGIGIRLGFAGNEMFLAAAWFNRVVMGLMIGLAGGITVWRGKSNWVWRGLFFGLIVSFAWYLDTGFRDIMGFFAGVVYGLIIDFIATRYSQKKKA
ncbi:hypothetical protein KKC88_02355 [Patescibacteria group bacterium]|nr:hypothetical protein [Patescibacteria group bacterium]MBU1672957.1 hypothetical protein [Patescibacteria group bacterium]